MSRGVNNLSVWRESRGACGECCWERLLQEEKLFPLQEELREVRLAVGPAESMRSPEEPLQEGLQGQALASEVQMGGVLLLGWSAGGLTGER